MKQLHTLQLQILKRLLFATHLRYSELKPSAEIENNQLDFHLDQLIKAGHVVKAEDGYTLTPAGKEYANRMDTDTVSIQKQAKLSVTICCRRVLDGRIQYLIYTRKKQPFYGCQGFFSGKIRFGESVVEAGIREMKEETNLDGVPVIVKLNHYRIYDNKTNELLEDKFMFYCLCNNPTGELIGNNEGTYEWVDFDSLHEYITNPFTTREMLVKNIAAFESFSGVPQIEEIDQADDRF